MSLMRGGEFFDHILKHFRLKKIIVAKMTYEGKLYVGKREAKFYDGTSTISDALISDANVGLVLRVQRQVRDALKVKHGLKQVIPILNT